MVISQGRHGARLRVAQDTVRIGEPVVVLGNNDASRLANYFHWTILILSRVLLLAEQGYLRNRRLLLPREITRWMRETLGLIGIDETMILYYGREETLELADAMVVSPIQTPSRALLRSLRARLWTAAGVAADNRLDPGGELLFMVRRNQVKRMILPFDAICDVAEGAGFRLVAPEELTVTEQVKLFAGARAIAGPVGAAFTNMLFGPDGLKVLPLMKEESLYPSFNDLAIGLDQRFRWCLGKTEALWLENGHDLIQAPYVMNLDVLAEQLHWAAQ
jgi:capsular polysaccharide biosynthesis protein